MVSIRKLLQFPLSSPPLSKFSPGLFVVLQQIIYQPSFALIRLLQKITHNLSTDWWSVLISLFCVYVILRALFHSSAIMKLRIVSHLHMCTASYFTSHQITWHIKRIHNHRLKITSCFVFFRFPRKLSLRLILPYNFTLLISFRKFK